MQRGISQQPAIEQQFFSQQNKAQLYNTLIGEFQQRNGGLAEKQQVRLEKTLNHYLSEIWDANGPMPLPKLNREVLTVTANDFSTYLRRDSSMMPMAVSQAYVSDTRNQPQMDMASRIALPPRPTFEQNLLQDTGSRFEQLQQERITPKESRPPLPDFKQMMPSFDEEQSSLTLFEQAKKNREDEALRAKPVGGSGAITDANPLVRFINPPSSLNDAQANPTLAMPTISSSTRGPLPQDFIIKQEDVLQYRETEYNLFLYSADRDWLNNSKESRYNFTVNFDPANNRQGFTISPSSTKKFKNISRIELVKAIIPTEGIDNLVTRSGTSFVTSSKLNILNFPYIVLRIPELDGNNYGTDTNLDNAFAVLQYDANWYSDTTNLTDGYLAMIPKFMKCQKVYHPTPLATLTKLSIELQLPNGNYISDIADTVSISNIFISGSLPSTTPPFYNAPLYSGVVDANSNGEYIILVTNTYFSQWMFAKGNTIQIKGLDASQIVNPPTAAANDLLAYLQQEKGITIVGIATSTTSSPATDGANTAGYANMIIVRAPHADPTSGSVLVTPFGGTNTTMSTLATSLKNPVSFTGAKLINLTHQTHVVLRIITRELDPTTRVRPDNL